MLGWPCIMPPLHFQWKMIPLTRPAVLLLLLASATLSGCGFVGFPGVYKIDVEQGNLVDQEMIEQLKPGMSRRQARFIMGSPLVEDTFNPDRWDYPYVIRNGQDIIREAQVTLIFEGDTLTDVRGDYLPEWKTGGSGDSAGEDAATDEATEEATDEAIEQ